MVVDEEQPSSQATHSTCQIVIDENESLSLDPSHPPQTATIDEEALTTSKELPLELKSSSISRINISNPPGMNTAVSAVSSLYEDVRDTKEISVETPSEDIKPTTEKSSGDLTQIPATAVNSGNPNFSSSLHEVLKTEELSEPRPESKEPNNPSEVANIEIPSSAKIKPEGGTRGEIFF